MKPIFENIDVAIDSSLKIETYTHGQGCELANWHIHPEYEMVYVKNGNGVLQIDGKVLNYYNGVLLFLGPNIPHADFGNKDHKDNLEVVIQFGKEFLEEKLNVFPEFKRIKRLIRDSRAVILFDQKIKKRLEQDFEELQEIGNTQRLIQFISILEKLSIHGQYSLILGQKKVNSFKSQDVERLEHIFEYVNENYSEKISIERLATLVRLTPNSFCRFFKRMTNQTFVQFLNEFRTRKAMEFFDQSKLSVSEVMYKCGFNDPSYFTRQFKKHQGLKPSTYLSNT